MFAGLLCPQRCTEDKAHHGCTASVIPSPLTELRCCLAVVFPTKWKMHKDTAEWTVQPDNHPLDLYSAVVLCVHTCMRACVWMCYMGVCFMYVPVYMWVHAHIACTWRPEMTIKWLPQLLSPYLLKRGLSLNLTFTDSARMDGHQASRLLLRSPLSQCGITGTHGHTRLFMCWWGFELRVASTLSTEKSPQTPVILVLGFFCPVGFLDYAWLRSGEVWCIVSKVWLFTTINL